MRLLLDMNLPPTLADWLQSEGHEAAHVRELGLLLRLRLISGRRLQQRVQAAFAAASPALEAGAIVVVEDARIRIRLDPASVT